MEYADNFYFEPNANSNTAGKRDVASICDSVWTIVCHEQGGSYLSVCNYINSLLEKDSFSISAESSTKDNPFKLSIIRRKPYPDMLKVEYPEVALNIYPIDATVDFFRFKSGLPEAYYPKDRGIFIWQLSYQLKKLAKHCIADT